MLAHDDPRIDAERLHVLATDINREIIRTARRGVYETSQTTDIAAELAPLSDIDPYIHREGDSFRVRDRIKDLVTFRRHDLIRGGSRSGKDLVLCRNLLIYIDASFKEPIFETIVGSMRDGAYLMIGMTETVPSEMRDTFEPVDKQHRIYRKA
jgi:chemotaxis protein methyltransferase CheR